MMKNNNAKKEANGTRMPKRALVAGSFDPVTLGHYDIIRRASLMYSDVTVCIFVNPDKKTMFTLEERKRLLDCACAHFDNVTADTDCGLLAVYAAAHSVDEVVKGIRNDADEKYEKEMAACNAQIVKGTKTVFLKSAEGFENISSTLVRSLLTSDDDTDKAIALAREYLAPGTEDELRRILLKKHFGENK